MRTLRTVNAKLLGELASRLGMPLVESRMEGRAYRIQLPGLGHERSRQHTSISDPYDWAAIKQIERALDERRLLIHGRVARASDQPVNDWLNANRGVNLFKEIVRATPVAVATPTRIREVGGPPSLVVWVSEPLVVQDFVNDWTPRGTFLFIVEDGHQQPVHPPYMFSGISSLRAFVEFTIGALGYTKATALELCNEPDVYGRDDTRHPIDKLTAVGGIPGIQREVETIYRVSYLTDEQRVEVDGESMRFNDALAYPLYIAT